MGSVGFLKFWSSIVNDDNIQGQLKSVMSIEDGEERALQLLSRTLFLLVMEIKHERDEAIKTLSHLKERVDKCTCAEKIVCGVLDIGTNKSADVQPDVPTRQEMHHLNCQKNPVVKIIPNKKCAIEENLDSSEIKEKKLASSQIVDRSYRCLSRTPKSTSPKIIQDAERKGKSEMNVESVGPIAPKILAPETLSLDENELFVNVSKRRALATQTVSIPDSPAMENTRAFDTNAYENTDFYKNSLSNVSEILDGTYDSLPDSPIDGEKKLKSPLKDKVNMQILKSKKVLSPVLGKQNRLTALETMRKSIDSDFPKALNFDTNRQLPKLLDIHTPESKDSKVTGVITSTPKYSPLLFTHNISTSLNDSDPTSPSLLPGVKNNIKYNNEGNHNSLPKNMQNQTRSFSKTRTILPRSASISNMSPPRANTRSLRKCQTVDRLNKGTSYMMVIEPPDSKKKKYKQTKISPNIFQKKTDVAKITGGLPSRLLSPLNEDAAISAALEESIKTKVLDDMMRKKREALLIEASGLKKTKGATDMCSKSEKELGSASCPKEGSPRKVPKLSPTRHMTSPKKRKQDRLSNENRSPNKRKKVEQQSKMKKDAAEEVLELDQLLKQVNDSPEQETAVEKKAQRKAELKKPRTKVIDDSFDVLPITKEPDFAHRGEVVRKKAARKQLKGWNCQECEQWYAAVNSQEKEMMMNKCSRHRSKHNPVANTPENFWNPDWID
ncbi:calponin homology domain-containing protein DDB_G0272472 [Procambarus clarkii]|uniref:calponin homology domain-containing protein DDB_G0272472 n=1 Tax=Procambarus clarkii TaxID=6728 RepID=UPI003742F38C